MCLLTKIIFTSKKYRENILSKLQITSLEAYNISFQICNIIYNKIRNSFQSLSYCSETLFLTQG